MTNPLKVCQLCTVDFTLRTLLLPLVDAMEKCGWEVTCVCSDGKWVEQLRDDGYRIVTIPMSRKFTDLFSHLTAFLALYRLFRQRRFDVLHVHSPIAALLGRLAGRLAGVPLIIYTAHGFHFHDEMGKWKYHIFLFLEKMAGRLTDFIFTQSQEDRQAAVNHGLIEQTKVAAIGNGVDPALFVPLNAVAKASVRMELLIPASAIVVGVVCRMVREKGLVELLDAAMQVTAAVPNAYFLFVGERISSERDAPFDHEWQLAAERLGPRLIAAGFRADVPRMLGAMDIFCLPSYREGMPRSIIEAMMMGLPVVATNIRGAREEVIPEETGLLVPVRDADALVHALKRLLFDEALCQRMGTAGRQRAIELYDETHVISRELSIISTLISEKIPA
jgi:glycosyltransferase involved in cell wall biosynthesis